MSEDSCRISKDFEIGWGVGDGRCLVSGVCTRNDYRSFAIAKDERDIHWKNGVPPLCKKQRCWYLPYLEPEKQ